MPLRRAALVLASLFAVAPAASGQTGLRDLLTNFLQQGITLAPAPLVGGVSHIAHFNSLDSPQFIAIRQFSDTLAIQLSTLPLPSSAGGFSYRYDPAAGFTRVTESFGPVYAERYETLGKGRANLGLSYNHFTFDRLNDMSLTNGDVKLVFTHAPVPIYVAGDVITANLSLHLTTDVTAFVFSYGISDRFDVGLALPIERVSLSAQTDATIRRLATGPTDNPPTIHRFPGETSTAIFRQSGTATGVGDVLLRGKFQVAGGQQGGLAVEGNVRLPTGEERDLLGAGVTQFTGSIVASVRFGGFSPHVNAGYTTATQPKDDRSEADKAALLPRRAIPDQISYTGGFDWAVHPRITFAVDVLGRTFRKGQFVSVQDQTFFATTNENPPRNVSAVFPRLTSVTKDSTSWTGSVGVKVNPFGTLLVTANTLFSLNREGLQDKFTPLIALEYSF